jgi:hypothetical protein
MPAVESCLRLPERDHRNLFPCWIDTGTEYLPALFTRAEVEAARERGENAMIPPRPGLFRRLWAGIWG